MSGVRVARPLWYLVAGGALALLSSLLPAPGWFAAPAPSTPPAAVTPGTVAPGTVAPGAGAPGTVAPGAGAPVVGQGGAGAPCGRVADSIRPSGPLPAPGAMPAGSTMAAIVARGRLIAGVDQSKYLDSYRDPATGDLRGSDIDLVHQIAAALFGDPTKVQFVALSAADRSVVLDRGEVDMVVDTFTVTCQRQRGVAFSSDYMLAAQRILVPAAGVAGTPVRDVEDLAGQKVCTSSGSTTETVLRELPLHLDVLTLPGVGDCVVALQRGQVAAVSSDDVILAGFTAQDPRLRVLGRPLEQARYAIGMSRKTPDLVQFVNGVLDRDRADGSLAASFRHWYGGVLTPTPTPPPAHYTN